VIGIEGQEAHGELFSYSPDAAMLDLLGPIEAVKWRKASQAGGFVSLPAAGGS
jgi:hypothetical protein